MTGLPASRPTDLDPAGVAGAGRGEAATERRRTPDPFLPGGPLPADPQESAE
jgi:hypothetical protein